MLERQWRGALLCLVATVSWGAMFPVMGGALTRIDPFTFTALRYLLALLGFVALLSWREGRAGFAVGRRDAISAWFFGSAGFAGFNFLVFWGQQLAGPQGALTASIMAATMPMLALLLNTLLGRARPRPVSVLLVALSFAGILLVVSKGSLGALGAAAEHYGADLMILAGALCWVIYTLGASFHPGWSPLKYTTVTSALGFVTVLGVTGSMLALGSLPLPSAQTLASVAPHLVYMAAIAGIVAVLSWNVGNRVLGTASGSLFLNVVPLTAFVISALQGVLPAPMQIAGGLLTAAALAANNLYMRQAARPPIAPMQPANQPRSRAA